MTKRKLVVVLAVVVLLAAGAVVAVVVGSDSPPVAKSCDIPGSVPEQPVSAESAPGGGGIEVVEQGFSHGVELSMGAVLRNTSTHIAYRTKVMFTAFARGDHDASVPLKGPPLVAEIPVMLPGQRVGVGRGGIGSAARVTSFAVDRQTTTWLPNGTLGSGFEPATTEYRSTIRNGSILPYGVVHVHYAENSASCRALTNRQTAAVFRDAGGKIVGGDLGVPGGAGDQVEGEQLPSSPSCSPGERETWIASRGAPRLGPPSNVDDRRTELYSYCDLNAPPSDVNRPF